MKAAAHTVALVKQDPTLDALAADGALAHSVTTELASAVAAHEDHILKPIQTHGAHGLLFDVLQLLLQLLNIGVDISVVFVPLHGWDISTGPT